MRAQRWTPTGSVDTQRCSAASLRNRSACATTDDFAALLLDHGADPNVRVSLHKQMRFVGDELMHEYRDMTPLSWGARFHDREFVSEMSVRLVEKCGGRP
jgi:ankyrin repeat protein